MSKQGSSNLGLIDVKKQSWVLLIVVMLFLMGCQSYVTPGGGANLAKLAGIGGVSDGEDLNLVDLDIMSALGRKPMAPFPAHLALVRIQEPGYRSYSSESYGYGNYSVVTAKDVEAEEHFKRLERLPMISAVAPLNQILIPQKLASDKELRVAAANLHADLLLVYTFNTIFRVKDHDIGPLGIITLGFLPNQEAQVTTTASAVIFDVRSGFVYGLAESIAKEKEMSSIWVSKEAVEESRIKAETKAFEQLLGEIELAWKGIVEQYATSK